MSGFLTVSVVTNSASAHDVEFGAFMRLSEHENVTAAQSTRTTTSIRLESP